MKKIYLKRSKHGMLDALAYGYTEEYINSKKAEGYIEISEEEGKYYWEECGDLHVNYDYE